ncbi:hypothetical protein BVIET440_260028 [Burkholderia vietnamiensis]
MRVQPAMVPGFASLARVGVVRRLCAVRGPEILPAGVAGPASRARASKSLRFRGRWITLCVAAATDSRATRHPTRPGASGRRLSGPAGPHLRAPAAGPCRLSRIAVEIIGRPAPSRAGRLPLGVSGRTVHGRSEVTRR